MFYFVHLEAFDEVNCDVEEYKFLVQGNDFHDVINNCECYVGKNNIEKFTLIEPITDLTVLIVNPEIEQAIRDIELNSFL